jgi:hypothetical protein
MKSLISIFLQFDDAVDVTSRHVTSHHALGRCVVSTSLTLHHADFVDVVDTSSRHEHLPEIKIRKVSYVHRIFNFEITFFLKTDKFKSVFKLLLTNPGRKLWPILVLLYFQIQQNLPNQFFKDNKIQT